MSLGPYRLPPVSCLRWNDEVKSQELRDQSQEPEVVGRNE